MTTSSLLRQELFHNPTYPTYCENHVKICDLGVKLTNANYTVISQPDAHVCRVVVRMHRLPLSVLHVKRVENQGDVGFTSLHVQWTC